MDGPELCEAVNGFSSEDGLDAEAGFVDITWTSRVRSSTTHFPVIQLAAKPPLASELEPGEVIEYGLVIDNNRDGMPDFEIGINNSPGGGQFRVWVTDLARSETVEQNGPPYGAPVDFAHPDEQEANAAPAMRFLFLGGPTDTFLNHGQYRYYAWASYSEAGVITAWDYAPSFGWLDLPECEPLPLKGWPTTSANAPGFYSWDGRTCGNGFPEDSCTVSPEGGVMSNGNGSGDASISFEVLPEPVEPPEGENPAYHEIAGRWALYRRIDAQEREWILDIDDTTIAIRLSFEGGTSDSDREDANAIIESLRYEPTDTELGFRLVFTLTNDEWDSG
jgi:hypothetical protein